MNQYQKTINGVEFTILSGLTGTDYGPENRLTVFFQGRSIWSGQESGSDEFLLSMFQSDLEECPDLLTHPDHWEGMDMDQVKEEYNEQDRQYWQDIEDDIQNGW